MRGVEAVVLFLAGKEFGIVAEAFNVNIDEGNALVIEARFELEPEPPAVDPNQTTIDELLDARVEAPVDDEPGPSDDEVDFEELGDLPEVA